MSRAYIGINIGAISVKLVGITDKGDIFIRRKNHLGLPLKVMDELLEGLKIDGEKYYGVSGHLGDISEVVAIERALQYYNEEFDAVASLGGEAMVLYVLNGHEITNVLSHDKCAAGSGEFFVQQIQRLNLSLEEAIRLAKKGKSIRIASRCSVHAKSDITHKLNKGEATIEDVLYSVLESTANKVITLMNQSRKEIKRLLVIGGVSLNDTFIEILQSKIPEVEVVVKDTSPVFEALGAALIAKDEPLHKKPVIKIRPSFSELPNLAQFEELVKVIPPQKVDIKGRKGPFILGVDVGSTTTKAILLDPNDHAIVASHYGRTNGNPVRATKECLQKIIDQVGDQKVFLIGVTGSGREITGAFLGTSAVYNEISAHARGAAEFDPEVDTIFEIGGQDSKYVYLQNGVPIDYAMNAACSAGTGSFLEESSKSDLGITVYDIAGIALTAPSPVKFKADCAAFINSDIRTALQEGYERENIVGGLVYSIVSNYLNKVKEARPVGKKVFFQGGVAKNVAVGYAFAQATGKQIIIPPHPELMGAFGVALMAKERYEQGIVQPVETTLSQLSEANMKHLGSFTCRACENYCTIERYEVAGRKFPFGGLCSRYENQWKRTKKIEEEKDLVELRTNLIFEGIKPVNSDIEINDKTIGIPRALLVHSLSPLFSTFFEEMGYNVVISGIDRDMELVTNAPFCYPVQIAHGAILDLKKHGVKKIFFPHIYRMPKGNHWKDSTFCPMTQGSPFYIDKAIPDVEILKPSIDFAQGYENSTNLIDFAVKELGVDRKSAEEAYNIAVKKQLEVEEKLRQLGKQELDRIISSGKTGIILVGRSYNAFPAETSQSVARKLISKGIPVIPFDFLEFPEEGETAWYFPNLIMNAVNLVKKHENLFLLYISNYSCNVDAFTQNLLRSKMGSKPYLILEIDAHTGDAGTQTRLEAFIEIINNYRKIYKKKEEKPFQPAKIINENGKVYVLTSDGEKVDIRDKRVKIHFPTFSVYHTNAVAMGLRWHGLNTVETPDIKLEFSTIGLQHSSGKECLPLPIALGHMLTVTKNRDPNDIILYFMLKGGAPCVVDAYFDYFERFIKDNKLKNVVVFDFNPVDGLLGIKPLDIVRTFPEMIVLGDIMLEMENSLYVAGDKDAVQQLRKYWKELILTSKTRDEYKENLKQFIEKVKQIPVHKDISKLPRVIITGDFYVRFSDFFLQEMKERFAKHGILFKSTDLNELMMYIYYDHIVSIANGWKTSPHTLTSIVKALFGLKNEENKVFLAYYATLKLLERTERKMRNKFSDTGLLFDKPNDVQKIYSNASKYISPLIFGEAVTAIGKGIEALEGQYDGLVLVGPYNCLPYKISQAILKPIYIENNKPLLVFDSDITPPSPNVLRLADAVIQKIVTQHKHKMENEQNKMEKLPLLQRIKRRIRG